VILIPGNADDATKRIGVFDVDKIANLQLRRELRDRPQTLAMAL
jgi:hypothetical protein